jgi:gliding motility-associated-like protein
MKYFLLSFVFFVALSFTAFSQNYSFDVSCPSVACGVSSASSSWPGYPTTFAFDNLVTSDNCWASGNNTFAAGAAAENAVWLRYDFGAGEAKAIVKYTLRQRHLSSSTFNQSPKAWKLQATNVVNPNTDTDWITLHEVSSETNWSSVGTSPNTNTYTFSNTDSYRYYRIMITQTAGSSVYTSIGEMQMMVELVETDYVSKRSNMWYFGNQAGVNFNVEPPQALTDGVIAAREGCSSICDEDGNLLFYSDGITVWNKNHAVMTNGTALIAPASAHATQSGVIVPHPGNTDLYYVLSVPCAWESPADNRYLRYAIVDMSLQSGLGEVTQKNIALGAYKTSERITAVRHANGNDIWVIDREENTNRFRAFLFTQDGIDLVENPPVISELGAVSTYDNGLVGSLKASPDGNKLAMATWGTISYCFELFDFNNQTGEISNVIKVSEGLSFSSLGPYGVEFSPNGNYLYGSTHMDKKIYQWDVNAADVVASRVFLGATTGNAGSLQLAPNGKIYCALAFDGATGRQYLGVIKYPNLQGTACTYQNDYMFLEGKFGRQGLPNFIQSYLLYAPPFNYENVCFGNLTQFEITNLVNIESVSWDFGDPASGIDNSSTEINPTHIFSGTGDFVVQLTVNFNNGTSDVTSQIVSIYSSPSIDLGDDTDICIGDDLVLDAGVGYDSYIWSTSDDTQTITINSAGTYSVTVTDANGCVASDEIIIGISPAPDATITAAGPFCSSDSPINLTAATAGGTWSGDGITDAVNGTFDPSAANIGDNSLTYSLTVGACSDSDNITIVIQSAPDATISAAGPFCSSDSPVNLAAATGGGTWSGDGITDAVNGTFDPSAANMGDNSLTYSLTVGGCSDSDNITIIVQSAPDATISAAGPFCSSDSPINLTAVTGGGTWSGDGITDAVNGTFDPSAANIGDNSLTYSLTVGGCSDSDNINILVQSAPDATISAAGPFCSSDSPINLAAATGGGTWSGDGITDAVNGTFDPSAANMGDNSLTYSLTVGACSDSDNITIIVQSAPDATITAAGPFCSSDSPVNLTAATAGGTWSGDGITDAVNGTFDPSAANIGDNSLTYSLTVGGCSDSDNITIVVQSAPDASISAAGPFCSSDSPINLAAATEGGTWSGDGITDAVNGTFDPSVANIGDNSLTYSLTVGGCSDSDNITIVVQSAPDASISAAGPFCSSDSPINLAAATAGGTWSGDGITDAVNGTFDPSAANIGDNLVAYTVSSGLCSASYQIIISVLNPPNAEITEPAPLCSNDSPIILEAQTSGGVWSGLGITDENLGIFDPAQANLGNNTITYSVSIGSCSATDDVIIIVMQAPDATISEVGPFCSGDSPINLTAATLGGMWSGDGITDAVNGSFDPSAANIGINNINYTVSSFSCTSNSSTQIIVEEAQDVYITSALNYCESSVDLVLTANITGGTWSGNGILNQNTGLFSPITAGIGVHQIHYEIGSGVCNSEFYAEVEVHSNPDIILISINEPSCYGFSDASIQLSSSMPNLTYLWSNSASGSSVNNLTAGEYLVTVTDAYSCSAVESFIVSQPEELSIVNVAQTDVGCNADQLGSISITVAGGTSPYSYLWNYQANTSPGLNNIPAGNYTVTVVDNNFCELVRQFQIQQVADLSLDISVHNISCFGYSDGKIEISVTGGTSPYIYSTVSNSFSSSSSQMQNLAPGEYFITVMDNNSCSADTSVVIAEPHRLELSVSVTNTSCIGNNDGEIEVYVYGGEAPYLYTIDGIVLDSPYLLGLSQGYYVVGVIDNNECVHQIPNIVIKDTQEDCIRIPNAFSPNADGINDTWIIENIDLFPYAVIKVFNRWGQQMFESLGKDDPWDGTYNGKLLPTGSYVYIVNVYEIGKSYTGIVTLVK